MSGRDDLEINANPTNDPRGSDQSVPGNPASTSQSMPSEGMPNQGLANRSPVDEAAKPAVEITTVVDDTNPVKDCEQIEPTGIDGLDGELKDPGPETLSSSTGCSQPSDKQAQSSNDPTDGADQAAAVLLTPTCDQTVRPDLRTASASAPDIEDLVQQYSRFLFGYAYRLTGSTADAEDLTQQTFLIACQKLGQLRDPAAARSWLSAILRSCWLKVLRKNQPVPVSFLQLELTELLTDDVSDARIDSQAIQLALNELPPDYRLVLLMFYFEDLSYQEISDRLGVKIGTVMSRLSRAKERIRKKLGDRDRLLDQ